MSGDLSTLLATSVTLDFGLFPAILHKASKDSVQCTMYNIIIISFMNIYTVVLGGVPGFEVTR